MLSSSNKRCCDSGDPEGRIGRKWSEEWPDQVMSLQAMSKKLRTFKSRENSKKH